MTKRQMKTRVNEILDTYLFDELEESAHIYMEFHKKNGELQTKDLYWTANQRKEPDTPIDTPTVAELLANIINE
ncbi:MAG: hypothetical protein V3G42_00920 [Oscillospiraceae bacterium]